MKRFLFLFSFQLHPDYLSTFQFQKDKDVLVFVDSDDQWTSYRFHKQRLLLHLSSVHHYVEALKQEGYHVEFLRSKTLSESLLRYPDLYAFQPTNRYEKNWLTSHPKITLLPDPLFLISNQEWLTLLPEGKPHKLDPLYRQFRLRFNILIEKGKPIGGQFSFDKENRKPASSNLSFEPPMFFAPDMTTLTIASDIENRFSGHPGQLASFQYPVTRHEALLSFDHFLTHRLPTFGDYQDAMIDHLPWMSHSLISSSLNLGLLAPKEVIEGAIRTYEKGWASLASTEGFIRQILGWREYVRGIYLVSDDSYLHRNALNHHQPLPSFYYDGQTDMTCLHTTIQETIDHGYNHHIQRLMVLSNYASLASVDPFELNRWFNEMYIDSSEWIVAANVIGMGSYADGGFMSTKPYVSSGAYIHKMSNYCTSCTYKVEMKTGEKACPFNILYWDYIDRHQETFKQNPRMSMMVNVWKNMDPTVKETLLSEAKIKVKQHG
jgi:deoxyribodipyrimidine photolyase-related protein